MRLCQYKNALGVPNQGIHSYRFLGFAVVDVVGTLLAAIALSYFTKWNLGLTVAGCFLLGIVTHELFCVETTLRKMLMQLY
jgi:hypothetical protein